MNRLKISSCILGTLLAVLFVTAPVVEASSGAWTLVSSPNVGSGNNDLLGVAAVSANNVWAVGYSTTGSVRQTLIEQWNGTSWNVVTSPNPTGSTISTLGAVTVISANDIWAVGEYLNSSSVDVTLAEHWNGTSWSIISSPNMGTSTNLLNGVTAVATNDVWAAGEYFNNGAYQTLIEQWNGTSWSIVTSPNTSSNDFLDGVAAVSANDIWAVGEDFSNFTPAQTLIEQWNGTSWSIVPSPNPSTNASILFGVAVVSANNVWAVGTGFNSTGTRQNTLTEQWNGTSWTIVHSPNPSGAGTSILFGVAVISASSLWAVGQAFISSSNSRQTLIEHWNGTTWVIWSSPSPGASTNDLAGVTRAPNTHQTWAVGYFNNSSNVSQTLTEFRS